MTNIKRFFRLNYTGSLALEVMVKTGTIICTDRDLELKLQVGDGILLAQFNEHRQIGEVRAIGIVVHTPGSNDRHKIYWVEVSENLYPSVQGMRFWRQPTPYFSFAASVVSRYRLPEMFKRYFGEKLQSPLKPVSTQEAKSFCGTHLCSPQSGGANFASATGNERGGYVYLIHSPYGYKIGKTKRMKQRSQLFSVKLPFEIDVIHYAWFDDYSRAEHALHKLYKNKRLGGEWFQLTDMDVKAIKEFRL